MQQSSLFSCNPVSRSSTELERDQAYAAYWLQEYGTRPDQVRIQHVFPKLQRLVGKYASEGSVYDFGCGAGSALREIASWRAGSYVGIDVNLELLKAAENAYLGDKEVAHGINLTFVQRDFEQPGWEREIPSGYDLGLSVFVLNELANIKYYLLGMRKLARRTSKSKRGSRLALLVTHPSMVLKDLADFYLLKSNQRKYEHIESYTGRQEGRYVFSKGNFSVPYTHLSMANLCNAIIQSKWKVEHVEEIYYNFVTSDHDQRQSHLSGLYPKLLLLILIP
jgi:SAM-dependent methyltransferase